MRCLIFVYVLYLYIHPVYVYVEEVHRYKFCIHCMCLNDLQPTNLYLKDTKGQNSP